MISITLTPKSYEIIEQLKKNVTLLPGIGEKSAEEFANKLKLILEGNTPVGDTQKLKTSWSSVQRTEGGFTFSIPVSYGAIVNEGLYPGVGPRTVATSKGIFSRQAPEGITAAITPELVEQYLNSLLSAIMELLNE